MRYVTYDESGALTGCYLQDLLDEHSDAFIEIDEDTATQWPAYRANASRNRVELKPSPPQTVDPIPQSVSPRQIRQAMTKVGMRAAVEGAVAAADQDTRDWYEFATEFRRDSPVVAMLAATLGVTDSQLDALWMLAGTL